MKKENKDENEIENENKVKNKKKKKFSIGVLLFRLISLVVLLVCAFFLYGWNSENNRNAELADDLIDEFVSSSPKTQKSEEDDEPITYEYLLINFEELLAQNENTVGWVKVNNTNINYPIVQTENNTFYLNHNFKNESNSAGWIYADHRNNFESLDKNTLIYGHNRRNETMFSSIKSLLNPEWFNNKLNRFFYFSTKDNNYVAKIFSVYKINKNKLLLSNELETEDIFYDFINKVKQRSIYDFNLDVGFYDNLITLCTCDNNNQYRIVVHAKLEKL